MRFVIDARYVRERPSGIGRVVEALVTRLPALAPAERFHLWTHPDRPNLGEGEKVTQKTVNAPADGLRSLLWPAVLDRLEDDDVVHFPNGLLGRGIRCATVVTMNDVMWLEQPQWVDARPWVRRVRQRFYQAGMRWAIRDATRLICISQATADRVMAIDPTAGSRIRVAHLAAPPACRPPDDRDAAAARAAELVGSPEPYYLVLGKNEPYKAHEVAVEAFARASRAGERLVLVQRTHQGRGLAELAQRLGVDNRVTWLSGLSQEELVTLLQSAKALLQPSLVEGFGLPVVEAMSCGCPVVTSDTPCLVEVVGGAGLHAGVRSVEDTAAALRKLHDDAFRDDLRARGLERAADFDWDETARLTLEAYREAAAAGPMRRVVDGQPKRP